MRIKRFFYRITKALSLLTFYYFNKYSDVIYNPSGEKPLYIYKIQNDDNQLQSQITSSEELNPPKTFFRVISTSKMIEIKEFLLK